MKEIKFIKLEPTSNDFCPLKIEGFTNLGNFKTPEAGTATDCGKQDFKLIRKIFLVISDDKFFEIAVKNPEDIFQFLQEQEWYGEKTARLLIFQLYTDWMESTENSEELGNMWEEAGIHPLEHDKAVKQIFNSLNELLNFKFENASAKE